MSNPCIQETTQGNYQLIKREWQRFVSGIPVDYTIVRSEIAEAWKRCKASNVAYLKRSAPVEDLNHFENRRKQNSTLVSVSKPAINYLYQFLEHDNYTVSISDADGYLLIVYGGKDIVNSAAKGNGIVGADWSERGIGNNPIGTAIAENRALQVFGCEHYCLCAHHWAGAGAPIHNPDGDIIGAISICGKLENVNYHTLGMAVMTAYAIEKQLKILEALAAEDIARRHKDTIINSMSEGLLVVDESHNIILTNQAFQNRFGSGRPMIGTNLSAIVKDKMLYNIIRENSTVTDYVTEILTDGQAIPCTITYRPINREDSNEWNQGVFVINEFSRAHKLAQKIVESQAKFTFDTIIGQNTKFLNSLEIARIASQNDTTLLITGESGTGKDILAQAIHNSSLRRSGSFLAINCGAMPKELIASELFGYDEGAFTGAKKGGHRGKFEQANGGTIFLDEIGEMPMELQPSLLRVIEQKMVNRIGSQKYLPVDIRIIAATNKNLLKEVSQGRFRQDLYYRLNVLHIHTVPLRERKDDIMLLANEFLKRLNNKYGKSIASFSDEMIDLFMAYDWPGNIRELENTIERGVALSKASVITIDYLPYEILTSTSNYNRPLVEQETVSEKIYLKNLLEKHYWNITKVAKDLGIARCTLYRKMELYNLKK